MIVTWTDGTRVVTQFLDGLGCFNTKVYEADETGAAKRGYPHREANHSKCEIDALIAHNKIVEEEFTSGR